MPHQLLLLQLLLQMNFQQLQLLLLQFPPINLLKTLIHPNSQDNYSNITILPKKQWKLNNIEFKIFLKIKSTKFSKILDLLLKN